MALKETQLLIGDNPFNGVDHLSQARSRGRMTPDADDIIRVLAAAQASGAKGFSFSTTPKMLRVLQRMQETKFSLAMGLYPVIPDIQSYFQLLSEKGTLGTLLEMLGKLSPKSRLPSIVNGSLSLIAASPARILKTYVKAETSLLADTVPLGTRIESVFLHEIGTDLMISLGMEDLFEAYCEAVVDSLRVTPGFVTRNFPRFVDFISGGNLTRREYFVLTPFNSVGFQMNPTKEACERALTDAKGVNVIAMSVLAGGYLSVETAAEYLRQLPSKVSCVVGISSERHALETFSKFKQSLGNRKTDSTF